MTLILKVTSRDPETPLSHLLDVPLGLDVWEVKPDHVVLRASDAQAERLRRLGYGVEQLHLTDRYLSAFATAEAVAGYHSAETLAQDLRQLAEAHPEVAEMREL